MTQLCTRCGASVGFKGSENGIYRRKSDRKSLSRWRCVRCKKGYSYATYSPFRMLKKRHLMGEIWKRYSSAEKQRRIAINLKISRVTVARMIRLISELKKKDHELFLKTIEGSLDRVYLDELRTFEHTVCKPLSVAVVVMEKRKILATKVARHVPNTQRLIEIARKKYGPPIDERKEKLRELLYRIKPLLKKGATIVTDEDPLYKKLIREVLPDVNHETHKSQRGDKRGFNEVKEKRYDPLFPINHVLAMLRDNNARLARQTWCTTKKIQGLIHNLNLYTQYHNQILT